MVMVVWRWKGSLLVEELVSMDVMNLMVVLANMLVVLKLGLRQVIIWDSC